MNYEQARAFIEEIRKRGSSYGLDGIRRLMELFGNVQEKLSVLHVAGTNGKGSVCSLLAAILQEAGYKVGVYSSPAVFTYREIYQVNGCRIREAQLAALAGKVKTACEQLVLSGYPHPSAFEMETAIAFCWFYQEKCDYVILETGMGGEADATNIITRPVCSIITSISRDHMQLLGNSLQEIAGAKAGIIKAGCPVVSAVQKTEVLAVLEAVADSRGSLFFAARPDLLLDYHYDENGSFFEMDREGEKIKYHMGLTGACQRENAACVLETVQVLRMKKIPIPEAAIAAGLARAVLPGRFDRIAENPDFYMDGAHNAGAALFLKKTVENCFTNRKIIYIIGVLADKEYDEVLRIMLPLAAEVFTITPPSARALDGAVLAEEVLSCYAAMKGLRQTDRDVFPRVPVQYVPKLKDAVALARKAAGADGVILAFGSFSYLGRLSVQV